MKKANAKLIAPCGLNCRLCRAYIRDKKACHGCRGDDRFKSKTCAECPIKNCEIMTAGALTYCCDCDEFPCSRMNRLEERYTLNYGVSVFDNLMQIQKKGVRAFVNDENLKWICLNCGEMLSMHKRNCISCGYVWRGQSQAEKTKA